MPNTISSALDVAFSGKVVSMRCYAQRIDTTKNVKYLAAAGENGFVTDTVQSDLV